MKIKTAILIVTIFILASVMCLRLAYADPYSADSMWIDPSEIDITEMSVGDKFNVTVWLNVTEDCGAWQFYLIYNKEYLNVTRYGLTGTGGAKSEFFENSGSSTFFPTPSMGAYNDTHNYILIGESWLGGPFGTGCGSLAWVEFEILAKPPINVVLDIASAHHPPTSDTLALDSSQEEIPLNVYNAIVIPEFQVLILIIFLGLLSAVFIVYKKKIKI